MKVVSGKGWTLTQNNNGVMAIVIHDATDISKEFAKVNPDNIRLFTSGMKNKTLDEFISNIEKLNEYHVNGFGWTLIINNHVATLSKDDKSQSYTITLDGTKEMDETIYKNCCEDKNRFFKTVLREFILTEQRLGV